MLTYDALSQADNRIQKPAARYYFKIPISAWQKNFEKKNQGKFKKGWANLFRDAIRPKNSLCSFSFRGYAFLDGKFDYFFRAWGHCKHGRTLKTKSSKPCWKIELFALEGINKRNIKFRVV